jgi:hypothetical protein
MITDENLNRDPSQYIKDFGDKLKDLKASTGVQANYGGYIPSEDTGKELADKAGKFASGLTSKSDQLIGKALDGLSGLSGNLAFKMPDFGKEKVDKDDDDDGLIPTLIGLIMGIIHLPLRFMSMSQALMQGTLALSVGIEGLAKSVILGTKDIITLIIAMIQIFFKYFTCILSFTITTIAGCSLIHGITFMFCVMYLIFPASAYFLELVTGYDMMPDVDAMFVVLHATDEQLGQYTGGIYALRWPDPINNVCYTCFGKPVKLRDVLVDVEVIKDIGELIMHDFTKVIPVYMRPSIPYGHSAMQHLDATFN